VTGVQTCALPIYVRERRKRFLERASDELVPFLNRIATAVVSGQPAQQAYLDAVEESTWLRDVLEDSAAKISSGERFSHALLETLPLLPLRMWSVFVRQLELYEEVGGDVGRAIEKSVSQVNSMLQLQAEARADYTVQSWQQRIIILIVLGATLIWGLIDPSRVSRVISSPVGIGGIVIGLLIIVFGIWFLQKQLKDLERKLSF
jgi:Flp pilus assembly protein TadB